MWKYRVEIKEPGSGWRKIGEYADKFRAEEKVHEELYNLSRSWYDPDTKFRIRRVSVQKRK